MLIPRISESTPQGSLGRDWSVSTSDSILSRYLAVILTNRDIVSLSFGTSLMDT